MVLVDGLEGAVGAAEGTTAAGLTEGADRASAGFGMGTDETGFEVPFVVGAKERRRPENRSAWVLLEQKVKSARKIVKFGEIR